MKLRILLCLLLGASLLTPIHSYAANEPDCPYANQKLTQAQLDDVLKRHGEWIKYVEKVMGHRIDRLTEEFSETLKIDNKLYQLAKDKRRANLCKANLPSAELEGSNLSKANFRETNLSKANLDKANLSKATLKKANLNKATLYDANLSMANLLEANLTKAKLYKANLSMANLFEANLTEANLWEANLSKVELSKANLSKATLRWTNLSEAKLYETNLSEAEFLVANLSTANLIRANLSNTDLGWANLSEARLYEANLAEAKLNETNLSNVTFEKANLTNVLYEPKADSLPIISSIALAKGLSTLRYTDNIQGLVQLRKAFREAGFRKQEREITYAIKHNEALHAWDRDFLGKIEGGFGFVFFEWTTEWGMKPGKALRILLALIFLFFFFYLVALQAPEAHAGIWRYRSKDRPVDLNKPDKSLVPFDGFWKSIPLALYFSVLSAFHFGWRDLNVGNWIVRLQFTEYTFRPTGWVRTIAGIQSLISVYLVAIWVLTYFGRPFE